MTLYKRGDCSPMVGQIQKALAGAGYAVIVDNIFGPVTEEAIKAFQKDKGLKVDGIVGPATLAKLIPQRLKKSKRKINEIVIHCSATAEGKDFTVDDIRRWHKLQGWSDIGYHYVVYRNGHVENGRDVDLSGAHAVDHNARSIGVCYIGGVARDGKTPKDTRTLAQKAALLKLIEELKGLYPGAQVLGHRDCKMSNGKYPNKACPSFDATKEYFSM